jgi:hypothetical protein
MSVPTPSALAPRVWRLLALHGPQTLPAVARLLERDGVHVLDPPRVRDAVAHLVRLGRVEHRNGLLVAVVVEDVRDLPVGAQATLKADCGDDREAELAEWLSRIAERQRRRGGVG